MEARQPLLQEDGWDILSADSPVAENTEQQQQAAVPTLAAPPATAPALVSAPPALPAALVAAPPALVTPPSALALTQEQEIERLNQEIAELRSANNFLQQQLASKPSAQRNRGETGVELAPSKSDSTARATQPREISCFASVIAFFTQCMPAQEKRGGTTSTLRRTP